MLGNGVWQGSLLAFKITDNLMNKYAVLLSIFLIWPISANCASHAEKTFIDMPSLGVAGQKTRLKAHTAVQLPASSFYRVDIECPVKPAGAIVAGEMGYPYSDIVFSREGNYECVVNLGILSKSSCAGVQYKSLGDFNFSIEIAPK